MAISSAPYCVSLLGSIDLHLPTPQDTSHTAEGLPGIRPEPVLLRDRERIPPRELVEVQSTPGALRICSLPLAGTITGIRQEG